MVRYVGFKFQPSFIYILQHTTIGPQISLQSIRCTLTTKVEVFILWVHTCRCWITPLLTLLQPVGKWALVYCSPHAPLWNDGRRYIKGRVSYHLMNLQLCNDIVYRKGSCMLFFIFMRGLHLYLLGFTT